MGKIAAVDVAIACAIVSRVADFSARDIHFVARCVAALHGGKAAIDCAHVARLEVHDIARAVVLCLSGRARANRPAAVGITVVRAVQGEFVVRRRVADCGTSRPDVCRGVSCGRRYISILELVPAEEDLLCRPRAGVGVNGVFVRPRGGNFLRTDVVRNANARHILHEDRCPARCTSRMLEFVPADGGYSPAREVQHGICLIEGAVEVEVHHTEIGDVARCGVGVDI